MTAAIVGGGLSRVTVATPNRRLDVALPDDVPIAEILLGLLDHVGDGVAERDVAGGGWVLRRATGVQLDPQRTLGAQQIGDGEVLHLVPRRTEWPELEYDDVVEAIASGARRHGRSWGNTATRRAGLAVAGVLLLLGLAVPALSTLSSAVTAVVTLVVAVVLTILGLVLARALGDAGAGAIVAGVGLPYSFAGGMLLTGPRLGSAGLGAPQVLLGSVLLLVFAVIGYVGVGAIARIFVAGIFVGALGVLGGAVGFSTMSPAGAAAVLLTVAIGLMPGYPLLAVRLGKLPVPELPQRAEDMLEDKPTPPRSEVFAAVLRADETLTGLLLGTALVTALAMGWLLRSGGIAGGLLVIAASVALLLRSRLFATARQRVPLMAIGVLGPALLIVGFAYTNRHSTLPLALLLLFAVLLALVVMAAALLYSKRAPSPYMGRLADIFDVVAIVALVPITCIVAGLYGYIQGVFAGFGG
ncbi:MAG: type VII secretion integral membrane protein EccD [Actinocatenispora sp.]